MTQRIGPRLLVMTILAVLASAQTIPVGKLVPAGFAIPKDGYVPTAEVAIAIAEAVLPPVYGKERIASERPFKATLKEGVWIVTGRVPCENPPPGAECPGGAAVVRISKRTGRILYMIHEM